MKLTKCDVRCDPDLYSICNQECRSIAYGSETNSVYGFEC